MGGCLFGGGGWCKMTGNETCLADQTKNGTEYKAEVDSASRRVVRYPAVD